MHLFYCLDFLPKNEVHSSLTLRSSFFAKASSDKRSADVQSSFITSTSFDLSTLLYNADYDTSNPVLLTQCPVKQLYDINLEMLHSFQLCRRHSRRRLSHLYLLVLVLPSLAAASPCASLDGGLLRSGSACSSCARPMDVIGPWVSRTACSTVVRTCC